MPSVRNEPDEMVAAWSAGLWEKSASAAHFARRPGRFQLDGGFGPFRHHQMVSTSGISRSACSNATLRGAPVAPSSQ